MEAKARGVSLPIYSTEREQRLVGRLNRIEGQVRGINKMIQEQRRCPDVLQQLASVQAALRSVSHEVFRNYLERCVTDAVKSDEGTEAVYDELMKMIQRFGK